MTDSKACPRTEISSGSTKPDKAPAELGTDSAELARDSSELLVDGRKEEMGVETSHRGWGGKEMDKDRKEKKKFMSGMCAVKQKLGC